MQKIALLKIKEDLKYKLVSNHKKELKKRFIVDQTILNLSSELGGDFDFLKESQIIIFGEKELNFLSKQSKEEQLNFYEKVLSKKPVFVLLTCGIEPKESLLEVATKNDVVVFNTEIDFQNSYGRLSLYLKKELAPKLLYHGTLLEVYGQGIVLVGKSGIGKSEVALELIKKGHRLVADDAILINQIGNGLIGKAPSHLKHLLEVRGIGLIDIYKMFGINSIADYKTIRFVIELDYLDDNHTIKRLEDGPKYYTILGTDLPSATILVGEGRNVAELVEVAVTNLRLRMRGYNPTKDLIDKHQKLLEEEDSDE